MWKVHVTNCILYDNVMHTVLSSVSSVCTYVCNVHTVSMYSQIIHRLLQFAVQVPAMLGFSNPSLTFNVTTTYNELYLLSLEDVPSCMSSAQIDKQKWNCTFNYAECRNDSDGRNNSAATDCHVSFVMSKMVQCMYISLHFWHKNNAIEATLWPWGWLQVLLVSAVVTGLQQTILLTLYIPHFNKHTTALPLAITHH